MLANTLHELKWDGRFSPANKQWAERRYIPQDERHNAAITVRSHPAVLDGFVSFYRKAVQALDQLYYQKGEHLYSHRRVWRNHARRIFGINYTTYASYLRRDVSHLPDQPEVAETVRRLDEILNK